jgi:hypothetical protein
MGATSGLESRIRSLEASRDHCRTAAWGLGLIVAIMSAMAMMPSPPQELAAERIVLTQDSASVVLVPGPGSSLVIQTPEGEEVARIGGPAARRAR